MIKALLLNVHDPKFDIAGVLVAAYWISRLVTNQVNARRNYAKVRSVNPLSYRGKN